MLKAPFLPTTSTGKTRLLGQTQASGKHLKRFLASQDPNFQILNQLNISDSLLSMSQRSISWWKCQIGLKCSFHGNTVLTLIIKYS